MFSGSQNIKLFINIPLKAGDGGKGGYGEQPAKKGLDASDEWNWILFRDFYVKKGKGGKAGETGEKCTKTAEVKRKVDDC